MNKRIIVPVLAVTVLGAGMLTASKAMAETTSPTKTMATLVEKIAQKFGLNQAEVQAVFDQDRVDRQEEREARYEEMLAQAVEAGEITEEQKSLILAKHQELQANRQQNKPEYWEGMTEEERRAAMETRRTEREAERKALEEWADQNNIDVNYLRLGWGRGGHGGRGPGWGEPPGMPETSTAQ